MNSFCIATWNLDNMPLEGARADACRSKIAEIQAQVWVLTEFREGFNLGEDFRLVAESQPATDLATDRRWTGIWAHKSLFGSKEPTSDPERTVCARVKIFDSFIIFVYGTVLPWLGSEWKGNKSEGGQAFSQALDMQKNDWSAFRDDHPEAWLCVAGDFNQDLLETGHYYGSKNGRKALKESLEYANLTCFTGGKTDPVRKYDSDAKNGGRRTPKTVDAAQVKRSKPHTLNGACRTLCWGKRNADNPKNRVFSLFNIEEEAMPQERLSVRKIREVIRLHFEAQLSNRAAARACQVSNSTVGEYLERAKKAGLSWPLPAGLSDEELYRQLYPEESCIKPETERPLPDWEEVHRELSKRGVTLTLLWQEYREKHPDGYGFTQFRVYYQRWNKAHTNTMRLPHKAGEEMQVDYAGMTVAITNPETGEISRAAVFVATLPASSYTYAEVQPSQELPHWLGGHVRAFAFFGGIPQTVCPDNLKSGVKSPNRYEPELNPSYQELAEYYHVAVLPARVRKPRDKAHVENSVQNVERWVLAPLRNRTFFSIGEANRAFAPLLQALNQKEMQQMGKSRKELFEELDQPALRPLPERPYEYAAWKTAKVNIDYHIEFDGHFYSAPYTLVRQEVRVRATESLVAIFHNGKQVTVHPRSQAKGRFSTRSEHMPANHQFVAGMGPDWILKEAEKIGPQTKAYCSALLKARQYPQHAYRACLGILDLARRYPHPQMETACQVLLSANLLSYRDLKSELERLDGQAFETVLPAHENVRGSSYYQ